MLNDNNKSNKKWFNDPWSYFKGAILISIMQILTLLITGNPWGVSTSFINWSGWIFDSLGGDLSSLEYFSRPQVRATIEAGFLKDPASFRNLGIIAGALISALLSSQFRIKKIKSMKQIAGAVTGGLLMGYGAGIASGCNIGAFYSSISSMSVSGWIFGLSLFIGAYIGSKLLLKFFI
ncbi:YeeE/YedE thiosulfate transporter family protein [Alkalibacter mobilis]|uniref:YeeE/YedE thiosulfate transporter family protein n=1 Tax=Alkalibacter mobilis TaxID=2787712 RepID=UPI00189E9480|nr:YeeE/YedE thiosulfate transporter family protein [Alkalibacter mobilis]MBF7096237.1 YeeE/YedE family protein [Alkalibacter mobilis]